MPEPSLSPDAAVELEQYGLTHALVREVTDALAQRLADLQDRPRPLLVDLKSVARMLAVSLATAERMRAADKLPLPLHIGGLRWRVSDIELYVARGCDSRQQFEAVKATVERQGK